MKKLFSLLFLAFVAVTVFIISCKKDSRTNLDDHETLAINKAKAWYSSHVSKDESTTSNIQPLWEKAEVKRSKLGEDVIIVPASTGNVTNNPSVEMLTSFLFSGNSTGIKAGNIVKIIGDAAYIKEEGQNLILKYQNQTVPDLKKGAIFIYDTNNRYLIGASIKAGSLDSNIGSQLATSGTLNLQSSVLSDDIKTGSNKLSSSKLAQNLPSTFSTQGETENCTDWYWTTWDNNTGRVISEQFGIRTCETTSNRTGSNTTASTNAPPPCLESFHYVTKVTANIGHIGDIKYEGGWQVAALKGLRMKLIDVPLDRSTPRTPVTLTFNTQYFGLPVILANGKNISYELAQTLTVNAITAAELEAKIAFKQGYMEDAIKVVYMKTLRAAMATSGGRVTDNPGINITIPDKDMVTATYPTVFGIGFGCF